MKIKNHQNKNPSIFALNIFCLKCCLPPWIMIFLTAFLIRKVSSLSIRSSFFSNATLTIRESIFRENYIMWNFLGKIKYRMLIPLSVEFANLFLKKFKILTRMTNIDFTKFRNSVTKFTFGCPNCVNDKYWFHEISLNSVTKFTYLSPTWPAWCGCLWRRGRTRRENVMRPEKYRQFLTLLKLYHMCTLWCNQIGQENEHFL